MLGCVELCSVAISNRVATRCIEVNYLANKQTCIVSMCSMYSWTACALNCATCNTQGAGKCDTGGCKAGYVLSADFTTCQGTFEKRLLTFTICELHFCNQLIAKLMNNLFNVFAVFNICSMRWPTQLPVMFNARYLLKLCCWICSECRFNQVQWFVLITVENGYFILQRLLSKLITRTLML